MPKKSAKKFNLIAKILSSETPSDATSTEKVDPQELEDLKKIWELTDQAKAPKAPAGQWQLLREKMHGKTAEQPAKVLPLRRTNRSQIKGVTFYAVRLAAALLISFITYWSAENVFFTTVTVSTLNGETKQIELPDGSLAELNAGSTLVYSKKKREVTLDGEAFFQVQPGPERFTVDSHSTRVTVLGTSFNVRAREQSVTVVVEHGKVSFANLSGSGTVELTKGQMSYIRDQEAPTVPAQVDLNQFLAWRQGRLEFDRTSLVAALNEIERRFGVTVHYQNVNIAGKTVTASFSADQNATEVISAVGLTFGWQISEQDGVYEVVQ